MFMFDAGAMFAGYADPTAEAMREELQRCIDDVMSRPGEKKPRKLVLTLEVTPSESPITGAVDGFRVRPIIKAPTLPERQRQEGYEFVRQADGTFGGNQLDPTDARQGLLFGENIQAEEGALE